MNKKQIRLTESDLKQIVKESVNRILKEDFEPYDPGYDPKVLMFHIGSKNIGSIVVSEDVARYFSRKFKSNGVSVGYRNATKEDLAEFADTRTSFLDTPMY